MLAKAFGLLQLSERGGRDPIDPFFKRQRLKIAEPSSWDAAPIDPSAYRAPSIFAARHFERVRYRLRAAQRLYD